jgi:hypothetical protein
MRIMRRLVLAGALCVLAVSTSGCGFLALLNALHQCSRGVESACDGPIGVGVRAQPGVGRAEAADSPSAARHAAMASRARGARSAKPFRVQFRGVTVGEPDAYLSGEDVLGQGRARGRFSGALAGSRLGSRFSAGRWTAQSELTYDPATNTATGRGTVLLRFRDRRAGSACLYVTVTRARRKNGALTETGTVTPISGSGLGARLAGTARFTSRAGDQRGRLRGRSLITVTDQRSESRYCPGLSGY